MCRFCDGKSEKIENGYTYGNAMIVGNTHNWHLSYDNSGNEYGSGRFDINYCPICGRKLMEECRA